MDDDDDRPVAPILKQLASQDLGDHSIEDLEARVAFLRNEINRAEEAIENKKTSRFTAEKFFK